MINYTQTHTFLIIIVIKKILPNEAHYGRGTQNDQSQEDVI